MHDVASGCLRKDWTLQQRVFYVLRRRRSLSSDPQSGLALVLCRFSRRGAPWRQEQFAGGTERLCQCTTAGIAAAIIKNLARPGVFESLSSLNCMRGVVPGNVAWDYARNFWCEEATGAALRGKEVAEDPSLGTGDGSMGAEITASVSVHSYKMTPGVKSEVSQMRVLMVGLGSIGKRHLRNLQLLGQTEFHALRSGNGTCPVEGGIELRSHLDLDRALAHRPDLTVIANPTSLHVPLALAAAEAGCHLFLEKPVSNSDAGVERLEREVRQRGLVAAVGYNLRFHPVLESLREMVLNRTVGEILCARA